MHLSGHSFASINVPCFLSAYLLSTAFKDYKIVLLNDRLFSLLFSKEIILQSLTIFTFSCNYPNDQHWIVLNRDSHLLLSSAPLTCNRLLKAFIPHIVGRPASPITAYLSVFVPYLDSCSNCFNITISWGWCFPQILFYYVWVHWQYLFIRSMLIHVWHLKHTFPESSMIMKKDIVKCSLGNYLKFIIALETKIDRECK